MNECVKCGWSGDWILMYCDPSSRSKNKCYVNEPGEHLHYRCMRCGYSVIRPCLDAKS